MPQPITKYEVKELETAELQARLSALMAELQQTRQPAGAPLADDFLDRERLGRALAEEIRSNGAAVAASEYVPLTRILGEEGRSARAALSTFWCGGSWRMPSRIRFLPRHRRNPARPASSPGLVHFFAYRFDGEDKIHVRAHG